MNLLDSLYNDFIKPYKDESPYHIGSIQQCRDYEAIDERVNAGDRIVMTFDLLIYQRYSRGANYGS